MKGNTLSGVQRAAKQAQRRAWLASVPDLLAQLPGANDDVTDAQSAALDVALRHMKHLRLYAPQSASGSVRYGIRKLVSEMRDEAVVGKGRRYGG